MVTVLSNGHFYRPVLKSDMRDGRSVGGDDTAPVGDEFETAKTPVGMAHDNEPTVFLRGQFASADVGELLRPVERAGDGPGGFSRTHPRFGLRLRIFRCGRLAGGNQQK